MLFDCSFFAGVLLGLPWCPIVSFASRTLLVFLVSVPSTVGLCVSCVATIHVRNLLPLVQGASYRTRNDVMLLWFL